MAAKTNIGPVTDPVKILVVSQNYEAYSKLGGIKKNVEELESIYARLQIRKGIDFRNRYIIDHFFKRSVTFEDLRADILSGEYDIIHFSLHSHEGTIFFSDTEQISHSRLGSLFSVKTDIKAVILNICKSYDIIPLICRNVQLVLGWSHEVIIDDAIKVSEIFYSSLFKGRSIEESFKSVAGDKFIKPMIYKDSKPYIADNEHETEENHDMEVQISPIDNEKNKITRKKKLRIILTSIGLILVLLIVPVNKILNPGNNIKITADSDSLQITFPSSGSRVERNEILKLNAKLRSEGRPWVFVLPPGGAQWWPQNGGRLKGDHWEFPVTFGNEIDSGKFMVLALIIKENIALDMQDWFKSRGTNRQSDPLSEELVRTFFWYEADTAEYYRVQR